MTISEYELRFKAYRLKKLDEQELIHQQAWANWQVQATKQQGKKQVPIYPTFKKFFDKKKFENEILGIKNSDSKFNQDSKLINLMKKQTSKEGGNMETYSVEAILSAVDKNFISTMKNADGSMGTLDKNTQNTNTSILDIAKGVGVFKVVDTAIGVVKSSLDGAINRFDTLNAYPKVMAQMGYSTDDVSKSVTILKKVLMACLLHFKI